MLRVLANNHNFAFALDDFAFFANRFYRRPNFHCILLRFGSYGMKTAIILPFFRRLFGLKFKEADINFGSYRELEKIILEKK